MPRLPLDRMSVEEKLELLDELWADLCRVPEDVPIPEWHRAVLAEREAALERGEEEVLDWEEAKARLRKETM